MPTECSDTVSAVSPLNLPQRNLLIQLLYLGDYAANFQMKHSAIRKGCKQEEAAISLNFISQQKINKTSQPINQVILTNGSCRRVLKQTTKESYSNENLISTQGCCTKHKNNLPLYYVHNKVKQIRFYILIYFRDSISFSHRLKV